MNWILALFHWVHILVIRIFLKTWSTVSHRVPPYEKPQVIFLLDILLGKARLLSDCFPLLFYYCDFIKDVSLFTLASCKSRNKLVICLGLSFKTSVFYRITILFNPYFPLPEFPFLVVHLFIPCKVYFHELPQFLFGKRRVIPKYKHKYFIEAHF